MKPIFLVITVLLLLIIGLFIYQAYSPVSGTFGSGDVLIQDESKVTKIKLVSEDRSVVLFEKNDAGWVISQPISEFADQTKLNELISAIMSAKKVSPISSNPDKQSIFGVDELGKHLILYSGKDSVKYVIGTAGPDFKTTYIRQANSNDVYIYSAKLYDRFSGHQTYRDKIVLSIPHELISELHFKLANENYVILHDTSGYFLQNKKIEESKLYPLQNGLKKFEADAIEDGIVVTQLPYPVSQELKVIHGDVTSIRFYKIPEQPNYLVTVDGKEKVYRVESYKVERMFKEKKYWLE